MVLADILRVIGALVTVYILLIFIRIMLLWFDGLRLGKAGEYLFMVTEPYLGLFRRFSFLRKGAMDFSPLVAVAVLALTSTLLNMIADSLSSGLALSLRLILTLVVSFIWDGIVYWILLFFLVLCLIRAVSLFLSRSPMSGGWNLMDSFIGPFAHAIEKVVTRFVRRSISYFQVLLVTVGFIAIIMILGGLCISLLKEAISAINI